jgi:hypothetical protein
MSLYITGGTNTTGKVELPMVATLFLYRNCKRGYYRSNSTQRLFKKPGAILKGLHITALKNIAVYAHIYASSVSGATLCCR